LVFVHARYREIAIKKNNMFHTIGKTQFGGVIEGLTLLYHSEETFEDVKMLPINATA